MVAEHLTVRNLTRTPVVLKLVERFNPPDGPKTLASTFTTMVNNITGTPAEIAAIQEGAQPFTRQDVDIRVEPFTEVRSDVRSFDKSDKERTRLTFEVEGDRYQIQVPVPTKETIVMKPLSPNPRFHFTGIFNLEHAHLALFSSANLNCWMRELKDDTLTSALSIPGTHNSPTCHVAPPSVRCQAVGPREQLDNGVRFFDIRAYPQWPNDPAKDGLILAHSVFPISLTGQKTFRDMLDQIEEFLDRNPSETLIMSLKREGPGEHHDHQLANVLKTHYTNAKPSRWYTDTKVPTLGQARGKIVLVRRFDIPDNLKKEHDGRGWGIDATDWADNTDHAVCSSGTLCIQDFYEVLETENVEKKIGFVNAQLCRSSECCYPLGTHKPDGDHCPYFVNFLSASNFWKVQTWPEKIAAKLNPATVDYICRSHKSDKGNWSTGIIVSDWVGKDGDWNLVRCIVGMNAKLEK
ncbi:1-phosphatidylinositol phosphodiesterase [Trichophyton mentagrophytes]|nr:1-phosphatidylinositol phosphodiesterase [Trichophyton mentagrophytes]